MKRNNIALLGLLLLSVLGVSAQELLTLEQCKQMALENNVKIKNARLEQKASKQTKMEAFTNYFPVISASGGGFDTDKGMAVLNLGVMNMTMMEDGIMGSITATQPVFGGGRIINGNKLAQLGTEVSEYQLEMTEDEVALHAEQYYWQIVSLEEKKKTINIVQELLTNLHKDVTAAYEAGISNKNDVLKVELKMNEIESNKLKLNNGINLCKMALCQYIGMSQKEFALDTAAFKAIAPPDQYRVSHEEALPLRAEYKLLDKNVEVNKLQTNMKIGEYLPQIGVGAGYMYHDVMDKGHDFGIIYATVSVPLSSWWGGSHAIKKQKINTKIAENSKQDNSELLLIQMQQLWNELEESYKQVELACKSITSATENVRLNRDYYAAGTIALSDLLDAQTLLQQSRDQYTEACTNYLTKRTKYLQVTNRH